MQTKEQVAQAFKDELQALRAQFEWSFAGTGYDLTRCEICPNEYADGGTNDLWLGYQAGHAAAAAETAAAVANERERCADIADQHASCEGIAQQIADAIRAGGVDD